MSSRPTSPASFLITLQTSEEEEEGEEEEGGPLHISPDVGKCYRRVEEEEEQSILGELSVIVKK